MVDNGTVNLSMEGIIWLSAEEEESKVIAQANAPVKEGGEFENTKVKPVITVTSLFQMPMTLTSWTLHQTRSHPLPRHSFRSSNMMMPTVR